MGGIFAQSSMDFNAVNMYTRAPKASENVHDISYVIYSFKGKVSYQFDTLVFWYLFIYYFFQLQSGAFLALAIPSLPLANLDVSFLK